MKSNFMAVRMTEVDRYIGRQYNFLWVKTGGPMWFQKHWCSLTTMDTIMLPDHYKWIHVCSMTTMNTYMLPYHYMNIIMLPEQCMNTYMLPYHYEYNYTPWPLRIHLCSMTTKYNYAPWPLWIQLYSLITVWIHVCFLTTVWIQLCSLTTVWIQLCFLNTMNTCMLPDLYEYTCAPWPLHIYVG